MLVGSIGHIVVVMTSDPWIQQNPRLAHDCGLALDTARTAAADAAIEALGLPPVDGSAQTPEQDPAGRDCRGTRRGG